VFTGIVTDLGAVQSLRDEGDRRLEIALGHPAADLAVGQSIACCGVCLTVVEHGTDWFAVTVSAETLSRTTIGEWRIGTPVNLERSARLGDELGGHLVSGHVDGIATLVSSHSEGGSWRMLFAVPRPLHRFIAEKGSVALDGVSLTVNEVDGERFGVNIIPHTWTVTTLGRLPVGGKVNVEIDLLARYVARILETA
jgi:riboflavin synthase